MSTRITKVSSGLRKEPRQARSRATVDAIVDAGARVLADHGWAAFTTNKVAEMAGASIGSLYQYFPDKLSLVEAIRRRHLDDCLAALRRTVADDKPLNRFVEEWVDALIEAHSIHPRLHRVLLDEAPNFDAFRDPNSAFEKAYLECYLNAVVVLRPDLVEDDAKRMAIVLSDAIDGVIHNAARRGALSASGIRHELVRLVMAYIGFRDPSPLSKLGREVAHNQPEAAGNLTI